MERFDFGDLQPGREDRVAVCLREAAVDETCWDSPLLSPSQPMTAYLLWLIARDLREWGGERYSKLTREEATALAMYLSDCLPPEARTEIVPVPVQRSLRIAS